MERPKVQSVPAAPLVPVTVFSGSRDLDEWGPPVQPKFLLQFAETERGAEGRAIPIERRPETVDVFAFEKI
jgi:hypothetical protein